MNNTPSQRAHGAVYNKMAISSIIHDKMAISSIMNENSEDSKK
jgi:hypothetical protein